MPFAKGRHCCGIVPIKTGVTLITIFGILNKLSGFYGILSFDFSDKIATLVYFYCVFAIAVFSYGLYGLHQDKVRILRWYTMMFWLDCVVSLFSTIWFGVTWFVYTDHSLSDSSAKDPEALAEHERLFKMESQVSIAVLVLLRLIHFYFAIIVTRYYKAVNVKLSYSRVASDNIDLEETTNGRDASPKPAQD